MCMCVVLSLSIEWLSSLADDGRVDSIRLTSQNHCQTDVDDVIYVFHNNLTLVQQLRTVYHCVHRANCTNTLAVTFN